MPFIKSHGNGGVVVVVGRASEIRNRDDFSSSVRVCVCITGRGISGLPEFELGQRRGLATRNVRIWAPIVILSDLVVTHIFSSSLFLSSLLPSLSLAPLPPRFSLPVFFVVLSVSIVVIAVVKKRT